jgi:hypothetical protein
MRQTAVVLLDPHSPTLAILFFLENDEQTLLSLGKEILIYAHVARNLLPPPPLPAR